VTITERQYAEDVYDPCQGPHLSPMERKGMTGLLLKDPSLSEFGAWTGEKGKSEPSRKVWKIVWKTTRVEDESC
jgi:hypothetical protein